MNYDEIFINELFQNDEYIILNDKCISQQVLLLLKQMDFNPSIQITNKGYKIYKNKIVEYELRKKEIFYNSYVYDISTTDGVFQAGIGNAVVKNTDSVFILYKDIPQKYNTTQLRVQYAIDNGEILAEEINGYLNKPFIVLEYEKVFCPFFLISKKKYEGVKYEFSSKREDAKRTSMGTIGKRRDYCGFSKVVYEGFINRLMEEGSMESGKKFVKEKLHELLTYQVGLDILWTSKALKANYKNPETQAHKMLAERMHRRDPGSAPQINDRIPYVFVMPPNVREKRPGDDIEHPDFVRENKINYDPVKYVDQVKNTLGDMLKLNTDAEKSDLQEVLEEVDDFVHTRGDKVLKTEYIPYTLELYKFIAESICEGKEYLEELQNKLVEFISDDFDYKKLILSKYIDNDKLKEQVQHNKFTQPHMRLAHQHNKDTKLDLLYCYGTQSTTSELMVLGVTTTKTSNTYMIFEDNYKDELLLDKMFYLEKHLKDHLIYASKNDKDVEELMGKMVERIKLQRGDVLVKLQPPRFVYELYGQVLEGNPKKVLINFVNSIKHLKLEFFVVNKIVKEEFNKKSSPNYIFWKIGEKTEEDCPKVIDIVFVKYNPMIEEICAKKGKACIVDIESTKGVEDIEIDYEYNIEKFVIPIMKSFVDEEELIEIFSEYISKSKKKKTKSKVKKMLAV